MRDVAIGQYYPASSVIHRLDPRTKLIAMIVFVVSVFFVRTFIGYAVLYLFLAIVIFLSKVPPLKVLKSLKVIVFLLVFTFLLTVLFYAGKEDDLLWSWWIIKIYKQGLLSAVKLGLRIMALVMGPAIMTFTTTPVQLTDGFESLLKPLSYIKVPVHSMAMIMSLALRLIPTLTEETDKIKNAQKARLANFDTGNIFKRAIALVPILIPLFVSSFRRADELADAMDSRCYRGAKGRTRMKVLKIKLRDILAFLILTILMFVILWMRYDFFAFFSWQALGWFL